MTFHSNVCEKSVVSIQYSSRIFNKSSKPKESESIVEQRCSFLSHSILFSCYPNVQHLYVLLEILLWCNWQFHLRHSIYPSISNDQMNIQKHMTRQHTHKIREERNFQNNYKQQKPQNILQLFLTLYLLSLYDLVDCVIQNES